MSSQPETVDLTSHLPAVLYALSARISRHAQRENARPLGLDMSEWRVLQILGRDGPRGVNAVADRIAMDRGGASKAVSRLERRGLVERGADPADRRRAVVALSASGAALHDQVAAFANWRETALTEGLTAGERETLLSLLSRLDARIRDMLDDAAAGTNRSD